MGAPGRHGGRRVRDIILGAAVVVLLVSQAGVGAVAGSATARDPFTRNDLGFACDEGPVVLGVTGSVTPSSAAAGSRLLLTSVLEVPASPVIRPGDRLAATWMLPEVIAAVRRVGFDDLTGVAATSWSADAGWLTVVLTAAEAPGELTATVTVRLELAPDASPGAVSIPAPGQLSVLSAAADPADGATSCVATGPPAVLATFTVTPSVAGPVEPENPVPPEPVDPEAPEPPPLPPADEPAGSGDAPSPPPLVDDEVPTVPPSPDPSTASRIVVDVAAARTRLARARDRLVEARLRADAIEEEVAGLEATAAGLEALRHAMAPVLEMTGGELQEQALDSYVAAVRADLNRPIPVPSPDHAAVQASSATYARRAEQQLAVIDQLARLVSVRAGRQDALGGAEALVQRLRSVVADARQAVQAFQAGGDLVVGGFHFVVAGPNSFTDTWLAPRSGGRRHQGTDIFAEEGVAVVAAERGVLAGVGTDRLGGTKLWLVGESGTHYYYAHLRGYADGVADGMLVEAGEVIGYVGHTGNARTTPPHLHLEIHPHGGDAVDGYPLLLAAASGVAPEDPESAVAPDTPSPSPAPTTTEASTPESTTIPLVEPSAGAETDEGFVRSWGTSGAAARQLEAPTGVAVDGDGTVYVADTGNDRVQVFDVSGEVIASWADQGRLREPTGVAVAFDGTVYLADAGAGRIVVLSADGERVATWGSTGVGRGAFDGPSAVAVGPAGQVYVADTYNHRIEVLAADGRFLRSWGSFGTAPGQFANPYGLAVDPDSGDLFVADTFNNRIQRFTPAGDVVAVWGADGPGDGQFDLPYGVAVGPNGEVTVTDQASARIQQFDDHGRFLRSWGTSGAGAGQFADPTGVAVDVWGRVVVADTGNARIQVFRPPVTVSP